VRISHNQVAQASDSGRGATTGIKVFALESGLVTNNNVSNVRYMGFGSIGIAASGAFTTQPANFVTENNVSNFDTGFSFSNDSNTKYRDNMTMGCTLPFSGGTPVGSSND
jgi:hypothetical protein